jgi:hypothetical protein
VTCSGGPLPPADHTIYLSDYFSQTSTSNGYVSTQVIFGAYTQYIGININSQTDVISNSACSVFEKEEPYTFIFQYPIPTPIVGWEISSGTTCDPINRGAYVQILANWNSNEQCVDTDGQTIPNYWCYSNLPSAPTPVPTTASPTTSSSIVTGPVPCCSTFTVGSVATNEYQFNFLYTPPSATVLANNNIYGIVMDWSTNDECTIILPGPQYSGAHYVNSAGPPTYWGISYHELYNIYGASFSLQQNIPCSQVISLTGYQYAQPFGHLAAISSGSTTCTTPLNCGEYGILIEYTQECISNFDGQTVLNPTYICSGTSNPNSGATSINNSTLCGFYHCPTVPPPTIASSATINPSQYIYMYSGYIGSTTDKCSTYSRTMLTFTSMTSYCTYTGSYYIMVSCTNVPHYSISVFTDSQCSQTATQTSSNTGSSSSCQLITLTSGFQIPISITCLSVFSTDSNTVYYDATLITTYLDPWATSTSESLDIFAKYSTECVEFQNGPPLLYSATSCYQNGASITAITQQISSGSNGVSTTMPNCYNYNKTALISSYVGSMASSTSNYFILDVTCASFEPKGFDASLVYSIAIYPPSSGCSNQVLGSPSSGVINTIHFNTAFSGLCNSLVADGLLYNSLVVQCHYTDVGYDIWVYIDQGCSTLVSHGSFSDGSCKNLGDVYFSVLCPLYLTTPVTSSFDYNISLQTSGSTATSCSQLQTTATMISGVCTSYNGPAGIEAVYVQCYNHGNYTALFYDSALCNHYPIYRVDGSTDTCYSISGYPVIISCNQYGFGSSSSSSSNNVFQQIANFFSSNWMYFVYALIAIAGLCLLSCLWPILNDCIHKKGPVYSKL